MDSKPFSSTTDFKECTRCGETKPLNSFPKNARQKSGLDPRCRACHATRQAIYYAANKERRNRQAKEWRLKNPERYRELQTRHRQSTYIKITPEEWAARREARSQAKAERKRLRQAAIVASDIERIRTDGVRRTKVHRKICPIIAITIPAAERFCTGCMTVKSVIAFPTDHRPYRSGKSGQCKVCKQVGVKRWSQQNREHLAALARKRYRENPDVREKSHARSKAAKFSRKTRLKNVRNDLTPAQWRTIKVAYKHRCAYCGQKKPLTMDHIIPIILGGEHTAANIIPACQSCNSSKGARLPIVGYQPHLIT